jgi:sRNA-binding regulator protein Hfq
MQNAQETIPKFTTHLKENNKSVKVILRNVMYIK